jgi:predicted kinase
MMASRELPDRVIVVGPPGSGKTTVAARIAEALGAPSCQLDEVITDIRGGAFGIDLVLRGRSAAFKMVRIRQLAVRR